MQASSTTWIYTLSDPRFPGVVRYVGKTRTRPKRRLQAHLHDAYREPGNHRRYWLRRLIEAGVEPVLTLIEECSADDWESRERHWIATYKATGCNLVNATDGGEDNKIVCAESRAKMSASKQGQRKGVPLSPEHRAKIGAARVGQITPPEVRAKMSASAKVKVFTPEHRAKLAEAMRKRPPNPEARARQADKRGGDFLLMSPTGEEFRVHNLSAFCRERGLSRSNLCSLLAGRIQYCEGWRIWRQGEPVPPAPIPKSVRMAEMFKGRDLGPEWRAKISAARSMSFIATTPTGEEIHGSNLTAFCAEHGLNRQSMQRTLNGRTDQVKGWRIRRPET